MVTVLETFKVFFHSVRGGSGREIIIICKLTETLRDFKNIQSCNDEQISLARLSALKSIERESNKDSL